MPSSYQLPLLRLVLEALAVLHVMALALAGPSVQLDTPSVLTGEQIRAQCG